ncbi:uncharacterized protein DS421_1g30790 [Arachis hypogaea]|nr:uncharacterized protein DS421_1g30790 [Arachis hypogaea]
MFCLPESFTLPYPTLATLFDPLPPLRRATATSIHRARPPSVRVATAPKSPTPLHSSSASSPHPLLFASSCRRLSASSLKGTIKVGRLAKELAANENIKRKAKGLV